MNMDTKAKRVTEQERRSNDQKHRNINYMNHVVRFTKNTAFSGHGQFFHGQDAYDPKRGSVIVCQSNTSQ